jgi:pimeloyl-ACP methyl ester carboxylesterase
LRSNFSAGFAEEKNMRYIQMVSALICLILVSSACLPTGLTAPTPTTQPEATLVAPVSPTATEPPSTATALPRETTAALLEKLGGAPCPDSSFTCVTLKVPLDYNHPANGKTTDVVFAVLPATGERKGMFVTATGGPGIAGTLSADSYTSYFDARIPENFDIVFFDQRGTGSSGGLQCAKAAAAYYQTETDPTTAAGKAAITNSAQKFAQDCVSEMGNPESLPFLGTSQAVEDLETFRQVMGDEKFWLYGESYGTQYAQSYAAAHPDRLAGLILDGTVDLTLTGLEFMSQQATAYDNTLLESLKACNADQACADQMGGDAVAAYDKLAAQLKKSPQAFNFPLPSGGTARRTFTSADLETAVSNNLYTEAGRMLALRALAGYARDNSLAPMARLLYDALGLDPETLEAIPDPSYSDAVYYAVECQDYFYGSAQDYLGAGELAPQKYFTSIFYGDLPCSFWPNTSTSPTRPAPLVNTGVPTLVLGATADPATPVSNGENVFKRLADGYLITTQGGAHIIFGRGNACPDDSVTAFLVEGKSPPQRESTCDGVVADAYVPIAPGNAAEFENPLLALDSAFNEIYYIPEYYYWDSATPTSLGCTFGGTLAFEPSDNGHTFTLTNCAFSKGFIMTGMGEYNSGTELYSLDVTVSGISQGTLKYELQSDGTIHVTGKYANQEIDLTQTP